MIRDDLRDSFLAALRAASGEPIDAGAQRSALLSLLRLRKSGRLTVSATKRGNPVDPAVHSIAEIAARAVTDRHRITTDVMLVDPDFRGELQREAELISPGIDLNQHVTESDRPSLAKYLAGDDANSVSVELHIFAADSPAAKPTIRRAYQSELIRSRHPKFNVRP